MIEFSDVFLFSFGATYGGTLGVFAGIAAVIGLFRILDFIKFLMGVR
jgi:hypothetical protein